MAIKLIIEAYIENAREDLDTAALWIDDDVKCAIQERFLAEKVQICDLSLENV
ncbi:MAG: hypothetical protein QF415_10275 [Candidatus Undinarchaeales archaeon]|jgi:hypothetical protein|nr:hypothetical protein [Candidatus Undinarchaeales archaeon]MDP7494422.1 hypothetical protein [Candidatus Undinarchaeales archaeon]